jgi:hypothetical protein
VAARLADRPQMPTAQPEAAAALGVGGAARAALLLLSCAWHWASGTSPPGRFESVSSVVEAMPPSACQKAWLPHLDRAHRHYRGGPDRRLRLWFVAHRLHLWR